MRNIISALDEQQQKPSFEQQQEQKDSDKLKSSDDDEDEGVSDAEKETKVATASAPVHSRQTLLCSATLTTGIEQLSEISLRHPGRN